jgi:hypothetical protein
MGLVKSEVLQGELFVSHRGVGFPELVRRLGVLNGPSGFAGTIAPKALFNLTVEAFQRERET